MTTLSRSQLEDALKLAFSGTRSTPVRTNAARANVELEKTLAVLALRHRIEIVDALRSGPQTAGQISAAIGLPPANFSRHLKQLSDAGIISIAMSPRDARERIISLRKEPFDVLKAWLEQFNMDIAASKEV